MTRRKWGDKARIVRMLAEASVTAQREGRVEDANAAYEALVREVTEGNAAYHMLVAEEKLA